MDGSMEGFESVLTLIDRGGVLVVIIGIVFALWKKHLVLGWLYEQVVAENKTLRTLLDAHAAKMEARVSQLEDERDKRYEQAH